MGELVNDRWDRLAAWLRQMRRLGTCLGKTPEPAPDAARWALDQQDIVGLIAKNQEKRASVGPRLPGFSAGKIRHPIGLSCQTVGSDRTALAAGCARGAQRGPKVHDGLGVGCGVCLWR